MLLVSFRPSSRSRRSRLTTHLHRSRTVRDRTDNRTSSTLAVSPVLILPRRLLRSGTGRRKALLIGINYFGTSGELAGCINDVHNVQRFLISNFGYKPEDMVLLTDDSSDPRALPTRENIIKGMNWLVSGAQRDDALFIH